MSFTRNIWRTSADVLLIIFGITIVILLEKSILEGHKYGFVCNDPKLSHKQFNDTVSSAVLIISLIIVGPFIIFVVDWTPLIIKHTFLSSLTLAYRSTSKHFKVYYIGLLGNILFVSIVKSLMGSPRPNFFYVCAPDTGFTCLGSEFVNDFRCTSNFSGRDQIDSYRSFPSGHTSLSVFSGLYLAWFINTRSSSFRRISTLLVPSLQLFALLFSAYCSVTRITDHRHHWWDVLAGSIVGLISFLCSRRWHNDITKEMVTEEKTANVNVIERNSNMA